jgi:uncharacterized integral membrane protein (TIGR00698 family)
MTNAATPLALAADDRTTRSGQAARMLALVALATALVAGASPALALVAGLFFTLTVGQPLAAWIPSLTKWLLQACVVLLGFGMNLPAVLHLGLNGSVFAAVTIAVTLAIGRCLGRRLGLAPRVSLLVSAGTAICGGSAIAAASSVIGATEAEIAVSMGVIFLLNAVALYAFPLAGHLLHLSQGQFGLWAGVAIHDISSVVGAGLSYGPAALQTAVAVKLSRSLWIVPVTLAIAYRFGGCRTTNARDPKSGGTWRTAPWFIGAFLIASLVSSMMPAVAALGPELSGVARRGMVLVLFLVGTLLSLDALRAVGWRTLMTGVILWLVGSVGSLGAIVGLGLAR